MGFGKSLLNFGLCGTRISLLSFFEYLQKIKIEFIKIHLHNQVIMKYQTIYLIIYFNIILLSLATQKMMKKPMKIFRIFHNFQFIKLLLITNNMISKIFYVLSQIIGLGLILIHCQEKGQTNSTFLEQANSTIQLIEKWKQINKYTTFEQTIKAFKYLEKNIKATTIAEMIDKGGCKKGSKPARLAIIDNNVYSYGQMKNHSYTIILHSYLKNITVKSTIPDLYFILHFDGDLGSQTKQTETFYQCRSLPLFMFSKNSSVQLEKTKFLLPDPLLLNRWEESIEEVKKASQTYKWEDKISKLYFRGSPPAPHFFDMAINNETNMSKYFNWGDYVLLSMQHPDLIDAKFTRFPGQLNKQIEMIVGENKSKQIWGSEVSLTKHIKYRYLLSSDGAEDSWKRIPSILYSNSVLFKPFSEKVQWFYDKLIPNTHFVSVDDDLSNLFTEMENMNKNDSKAKQMSEQANKMAEKYLSPEAIDQYTIQTLKTYASLQRLSLNQEEKNKVKNQIDINIILNQKLRRQQNQMDAVLENKWKDSLKFITFQQTIQAFPFIKENMNIQNMMKLVYKGGCGINLVHFMILDNQLYLSGVYKNHSRTSNMIALFKRVLNIVKLPDMFFIFHIQDQLHQNIIPKSLFQNCRALPIFLSNKNSSAILEQTKFLFPDPFITNLTWKHNIKMIREQNKIIRWEDKIKKAYFIGLASGPYFYDIKNITNETNFYRYFHRGGFIQLSNERPDLIQAKFTKARFLGIQTFLVQMERRVGKENLTSEVVPFETHLKYRYLLTADGFGSPWKRTPSILFTNSLLLKPFSEKVQWFYDKMIPNVHYIPINEDLSDLTRKLQQLNNNDSKIQKIIIQSNKLAQKYLTRDAIDQYTIQILEKYAQIQKLVLSKSSKKKIKNGSDIYQVLKDQFVIDPQPFKKEVEEQIKKAKEFQQERMKLIKDQRNQKNSFEIQQQQESIYFQQQQEQQQTKYSKTKIDADLITTLAFCFILGLAILLFCFYIKWSKMSQFQNLFKKLPSKVSELSNIHSQSAMVDQAYIQPAFSDRTI